MSIGTAIAFLLIVAFVAANLPWLTERLLIVFPEPSGGKPEWVRFVELAILYFLVGAFALGLEYRIDGNLHHQDWVFYVVTACLFMVFALPGFIYRHDLRRHLRKRRG